MPAAGLGATVAALTTPSGSPSLTVRRPPAADPGHRDGRGGPGSFRPALPIVEVKLAPPPLHPGTVPRPRLLRLLREEPRAPLVCVVAPAGYGKTVIVSQWAAGEDRPVLWLTLDALDNDPSVFLTYVAAAVDRIVPVDPGIAADLAVPRSRVLATAVPRIAHELHRIGRPALFVFDDVHRLADRTCLDAMAALLDYLPAGLQVVLAARTEPDLPIGRLRADRKVLEIGPTDLALDDAEAEALAVAVGRPLSPDEVRDLNARTEGWAAAVYLAVRPRRDGPAPLHVSGGDDTIADYLRSVVRPDLDEDDLSLLMRTAVLDVVEPEVAEAVAGQDHAAARLETLAHANQLIVRLGGAPASFRYHPLLREFLEAELERREPGSVPELHRRAAAWYATAGLASLAVEHAFAGGDLDETARLVSRFFLPTWYGGHADIIDRWLSRFHDAMLERLPTLAVMAGWVAGLRGAAATTDRMADIMERGTFVGAPDDGTSSFEAGRAMLRAAMARRGLEDVRANARFAAEAEPPGGPWRFMALYTLAAGHVMAGDPVAADAAFADAVEEASAAGFLPYYGLAWRATLAIGRDEWRAAEVLAHESLAMHERSLLGDVVTALHVHAVTARVAIHRGDLARGREALVRAQLARPAASHALPWISVAGLLEAARAYLAVSDPAGARSVVSQAESIAGRRPGLGTLAVDLVEMRGRLRMAAEALAGSSSLTPAELRLLPILSTHLTFQEIAGRLFLSRHTVKTQAISIYGKLGASTRGEAVARAVEIGLLEPFPGFELTVRPREG
jgi:LuxR family maltose regulon positive regulatory protein